MQSIRKIQWYTLAPIVVCIILAYCILLGGDSMPTEGWVSILVAIIGVIGTLIVTFIQLKRDGKTIGSIHTTTAGIDKTVAAVGVRAETIQVGVTTMGEKVAVIKEQTGKIDSIAKEIEILSRLRSETSNSGVRPDILLASMTTVFEENARLNTQLQDRNKEIRQLQIKISGLEAKVNELENARSRGHRQYRDGSELSL